MKHARKFMMDVFGTDNIEDIRRIDEKSEWNYVDNKIKQYLSGDNDETRELADDIEIFVHAPYSMP